MRGWIGLTLPSDTEVVDRSSSIIWFNYLFIIIIFYVYIWGLVTISLTDIMPPQVQLRYYFIIHIVYSLYVIVVVYIMVIATTTTTITFTLLTFSLCLVIHTFPPFPLLA